MSYDIPGFDNLNWGSFGNSNNTLSASSLNPSSNTNFNSMGSWNNPFSGLFDFGKGASSNNLFGQGSSGIGSIGGYGKSGSSSGGIGFMDILGAGLQLFGAMQQSALAKQQLALQKGAYQNQYNLAALANDNQKSALDNSMRRMAESETPQAYMPMGTDWSNMADYYTQYKKEADAAGKQSVSDLGLKNAPASVLK
jgi:hypothetical protein